MWNHFQAFSHDFTIFFIALNPHMNSWLWIHIWFHYHQFTSMTSKINSYIWILTYDFTLFLMIMNSYMNSVIWRILWNHTWNHVYQGSRWQSVGSRCRPCPLPGFTQAHVLPGSSCQKCLARTVAKQPHIASLTLAVPSYFDIKKVCWKKLNACIEACHWLCRSTAPGALPSSCGRSAIQEDVHSLELAPGKGCKKYMICFA